MKYRKKPVVMSQPSNETPAQRADGVRVARALVDDLIDMIADTRDNTALYAHATDALLTHAREARRLALEEAAEIANDWADEDYPPDTSAAIRFVAESIRARSQASGGAREEALDGDLRA